jgi:hypothetical protein
MDDFITRMRRGKAARPDLGAAETLLGNTLGMYPPASDVPGSESWSARSAEEYSAKRRRLRAEQDRLLATLGALAGDEEEEG